MTRFEKLKALASGATPGEWQCHDRHPLHEGPCVDTVNGEYVCTTATDAAGLGIADAAYIAACSPDRILQLLAVVESLQGAAERACDRGLPCYCCDYGYDEESCTCFEGIAEKKEHMTSLRGALAALKAWEDSDE